MRYERTSFFSASLRLLSGALFLALTACGGGSPDETSPDLTLDIGPVPGAVVNSSTISLGGAVEAGAGVDVGLGDKDLQPAGRPAPDRWEGTVALPSDGNYTLIIRATDDAGNTNIIRRTVVLDTTPPELISPAAGQEVSGGSAVTLTFSEAVVLESIVATLNGVPATVTKSADNPASFIATPVSLPTGEVTLSLSAGLQDNLGNTSQVQIERTFKVSQVQ